MKLRTSYSRSIPIPIWEEERALKIPIRHLSPGRPVRARGMTPLGCKRPGARFITVLPTRLVSCIIEGFPGAKL